MLKEMEVLDRCHCKEYNKEKLFMEGISMLKFSKDFFKSNEVIFVGYSSRNKGYSSAILNGFHENQIKVYPYNVKEQGNYDTKVFHRLEDIPNTVKEAYILVNKNNTEEAVKQLINKGVKGNIQLH